VYNLFITEQIVQYRQDNKTAVARASLNLAFLFHSGQIGQSVRQVASGQVASGKWASGKWQVASGQVKE
jgi:hypothetical protein